MRLAPLALTCGRCCGSRRWLPLLLVGICFGGASAHAHGPAHQQIERVSAEIAANPKNAQLYWERAYWRRLHRDFDAALLDYARCAELQPRFPELEFERGRTLLLAERPAEARRFLARFLRQQPDHALAHLSLARAQDAVGDHVVASASFSAAIARLPKARPGHYLERALCLRRAGRAHFETALRGLDEGIARLGPLVTLELAAIDLEVLLQKYDAALQRLRAIAEQSPRQEKWLLKRGEILLAAGRPVAARSSLEAALTAASALPASRGRSPAVAEIRRQARAQLSRLNRAPVTSAAPAAQPSPPAPVDTGAVKTESTTTEPRAFREDS